jgi:Flp pilus assembly pilin Flp
MAARPPCHTGQNLPEYALIIALLIVVMIIPLSIFGQNIRQTITTMAAYVFDAGNQQPGGSGITAP